MGAKAIAALATSFSVARFVQKPVPTFWISDFSCRSIYPKTGSHFLDLNFCLTLDLPKNRFPLFGSQFLSAARFVQKPAPTFWISL